MRLIRKILTGILTLVCVFMIVLLAFGTWVVRRAWPQVDGSLAIAGLSAPVEIRRDRWGIPHIYAQNEQDLFFAQGFVHAQDRLWQMEFNRRTGSGTLSAVVGGTTVGIDRYTRTVGLRRAAEQEWALLDAETRAILEWYAAGINAYINSHSNRLPAEFTIFNFTPEPWTPIDTLTWGKVMSWNLGGNYNLELLRARIIAKLGPEAAQQLLPPYSDGPKIEIPAEANNYQWASGEWADEREALASVFSGPYLSQGSNNWVVAGSRSASNKPIIANDTHLNLTMPSIWYENGLHGGRFNTVGFSFPGVPLVIIGHNERIAWNVADMPVDVQDLYLEKLNDPKNPTQYEYNGEWHDLQILNEQIEVRGGSPVSVTVQLTRHGPLMNNTLRSMRDAAPASLRWTINEGTNLFRAVRQTNLAQNWDQFREALRYWEAPSQHFIYADVDGNIGYQGAGKIPLRAPGHQGLVPIPGWVDDYEWQGSVPYEELYSVFNPDNGFLATANNDVTDQDYKHVLSYEWSDPYRIQRINKILEGTSGGTTETMQTLQSDTFSLPAETLRPYLLAIQPENEQQAQALEQLRSWDLRFESDQPAATIFQVWYWHMVRNTFGDELGNDLITTYRNFGWVHMPLTVALMNGSGTQWFDDTSSQPVESRDDMIRKSLNDTLTLLSERFGSDMKAWNWGKLHTVTFRHQPLGQIGFSPVERLFNGKTIPARGGDFMVNTSWISTDGNFRSGGGTAQRLIIDLSDWDKAQAINSTGQSGHLFHAHRDDMMDAWEKLEYHPLLFSKEQVAAATSATLTLTPAP